MKRLLSATMSLFFFVTMHAQKDVTTFLGIPVDGTKMAMTQKLKAKGFQYNAELDCLVGEFNGSDVHVSVVTNNNKVWRIAVQDANLSSEGDIKIRFNKLCNQFAKNQKYMSASLFKDYTLSEDEDISYKMIVENKRYEADYYQLPKDTAAVSRDMKEFLLSKYTQEQLDNPTENLKTSMTIDVLDFMQDRYSKKSVWFMISKKYGRYQIVMYYDNEYNHSDGEDL